MSFFQWEIPLAQRYVIVTYVRKARYLFRPNFMFLIIFSKFDINLGNNISKNMNLNLN